MYFNTLILWLVITPVKLTKILLLKEINRTCEVLTHLCMMYCVNYVLVLIWSERATDCSQQLKLQQLYQTTYTVTHHMKSRRLNGVASVFSSGLSSQGMWNTGLNQYYYLHYSTWFLVLFGKKMKCSERTDKHKVGSNAWRTMHML